MKEIGSIASRLGHSILNDYRKHEAQTPPYRTWICLGVQGHPGLQEGLDRPASSSSREGCTVKCQAYADLADLAYQSIALKELKHKMSAYHSVKQLHDTAIPLSLTLHRDTIYCEHQLV